MTIARALLVVALLGVFVPSDAAGQVPAPRQGEVIEIRGQVPTPQVVTVRPRLLPSFQPDARVSRTYDLSGQAPRMSPSPVLGVLLGEPPLDEAPDIVAPGPPPAIVRGDSVAADDTAAAAGPPGDPAARPLTAADSAALDRAREIAEIRRELEIRRARLDSLAEEVRRLGQPEQDRQRREPSPRPDNTPSTPAPGTAPVPERRSNH